MCNFMVDFYCLTNNYFKSPKLATIFQMQFSFSDHCACYQFIDLTFWNFFFKNGISHYSNNYRPYKVQKQFFLIKFPNGIFNLRSLCYVISSLISLTTFGQAGTDSNLLLFRRAFNTLVFEMQLKSLNT